MSAKANPTTIGGFVIGAFVLLIAVVVIFGSDRFFREQTRFVIFFEGSLQGLEVGAPVQFRGVTIGEVSQVTAVYKPERQKLQIPVIIDMIEDRVRVEGRDVRDAEEAVAQLIERGLRASLVVKSLVTGQQTVQLDFRPETPVRMFETSLPYPQIPTVPSTIEQLTQSLAEDAPEMIRQATAVLNDLQELFSPENKQAFSQILAGLAENVNQLDETRSKLDRLLVDADDVVLEAKNTLQSLGGAAREAETLLGDLNANPAESRELIKGISDVGASISILAEDLRAILAEDRKGLRDFTNEGLYEITNLAIDSQAAVEQLRRLLEQMEQDPSRFFFGKAGEKELQ